MAVEHSMDYQKNKFLIDIVIAIVALILLTPLLCLIALAIKIDSRGPILFKQKRVGRGKKFFYIYKFRTMKTSTPSDMPTHLFQGSKSYITFIGKYLRKSSLDELPQLFNIIKGDMSIIGPRPALWNQTDLIIERDKYNVNDLRPGLTGLAQINGRDELPIQIKAKYDAEYKEQISFLFDIKIALKTLIAVVKSDGIQEGVDKVEIKQNE